MTTLDHIAVAPQFLKPLTISEQIDTLGEYKREPLSPRVYVSQIWLKQDGDWRQSFYQETPLVSR